MVANRFVRSGDATFLRPEDAMASIEKDGFNWRLVREYFRFSDDWLSEGQYGRMLEMALASIDSDYGRNVLLDMLDLEYAVFLEQVSLQDRMVGGPTSDDEYESVAFGERVMAYLQINANNRPMSNHSNKNARSALFQITPGTMIERLLGYAPASEWTVQIAQQSNEG
jgi:hypothetical protein